MLDVVVDLQGISRLETHKLHADSVEILDLLHVFGGDADLLSAHWVEGADLIFVEYCSSFLANETLGVPKWLIVLCIDFLGCWLFGWHDCGIEAQSNLSFRR
jgi:hypothetical protein